MIYFKSREQHRNSNRGNWRNSSDQDFAIGFRETDEQAKDYLRECYPGWKPTAAGDLFALIHADGLRRVLLLPTADRSPYDRARETIGL